MKLINIQNRTEGQCLPPAWIKFGRNVEDCGRYNGFYLIVTLPIKSVRNVIINPSTYRTMLCQTYTCFGFLVRRSITSKQIKLSHFKAYIPV